MQSEGIFGPDSTSHHDSRLVYGYLSQPAGYSEEKPPVGSMTDILRDITRMNPRIFRGAKTSEDPQEFVDEVHEILVAMGATDIKKVELSSYQLKDVEQTRCKM